MDPTARDHSEELIVLLAVSLNCPTGEGGTNLIDGTPSILDEE